MAQAEPHVIIPRRNFLRRAFGITAAGATIGLPILGDDPQRRLDFHTRELARALVARFAGFRVDIRGNGMTPEKVRELDYPFCLVFTAAWGAPWFFSARARAEQFAIEDAARQARLDTLIG